MNEAALNSEETLLRQPPHSSEAEQAVIASATESSKVVHTLDWLRPEDFYHRAHSVIWERVRTMAARSQEIDPVTLLDALSEAGELDEAGGYEYIADLVANNRGAANAHQYAGIIKDRAVSRRVITIGGEIAQIGYEPGESQDKIDRMQSLAMSVETRSFDEPKHVNDVLKTTTDEIERRIQAGGQIVGQPTGFRDLDYHTGGMGNGDMVIVAGRPGMGKSVFAMNVAESAAVEGKFCIVFSLEMGADQLMLRSVSSLGRIPFDRLRRGKLEDDDYPALTSAYSKLNNQALYIDDNATLTSNQILSRTRKIAQKIGRHPDLVIVDYLQLLSDKGDGHERITKISRQLKLTAKDLNCPMVVLSQLNRSLEQRNNKRPMMSDLRESGGIEQDADTILMLYRDDVYNENTDRKGILEVIRRKQRNGELGTDYLAANLHLQRFDDLEHGYAPPPEGASSAGRYNDGIG